MITKRGYSKDPSIMPEGIVVTLGRSMIEEKCGPGKAGLLAFLRWFESCLEGDGTFFLKMKNCPKIEFDHVYIIVANRLYCRCYFGGYERNVRFKGYMKPTDTERTLANWKGGITLAGPIEKPKFKRILRGFQSFRYCEKLF